MCITFNISRKSYNIVFGHQKRVIVVARFVFDGWMDEEKKKKYHGSVAFYEAEAIAGRAEQSLKMSGVHRINVSEPEIEGIGTPINSVLEISFDPRRSSVDFFEDFFAKSGIRVHRADPFYKPTKTLGEWIKDLLTR